MGDVVAHALHLMHQPFDLVEHAVHHHRQAVDVAGAAAHRQALAEVALDDPLDGPGHRVQALLRGAPGDDRAGQAEDQDQHPAGGHGADQQLVEFQQVSRNQVPGAAPVSAPAAQGDGSYGGVAGAASMAGHGFVPEAARRGPQSVYFGGA